MSGQGFKLWGETSLNQKLWLYRSYSFRSTLIWSRSKEDNKGNESFNGYKWRGQLLKVSGNPVMNYRKWSRGGTQRRVHCGKTACVETTGIRKVCREVNDKGNYNVVTEGCAMAEWVETSSHGSDEKTLKREKRRILTLKESTPRWNLENITNGFIYEQKKK